MVTAFDVSLFSLPPEVQTKWASAENPLAEKGRGGTELKGRKGRAWFGLAVGESRVLAQEKDGTGTVRRIWITINDRSPEMLRGLRLEFSLGR